MPASPVLTGLQIRPEIQTATFSLDSFRITDTRSRHNDTDYVSFTLLVRDAAGNGTPQTLKKSMGDVNNGTHAVGLSFPNVVVPTNGSVVFNYLIVNSGHSSEGTVDNALETVGGSLAEKRLGHRRNRAWHCRPARPRHDSWRHRRLARRSGHEHSPPTATVQSPPSRSRSPTKT
jgi:hypothetical protein